MTIPGEHRLKAALVIGRGCLLDCVSFPRYVCFDSMFVIQETPYGMTPCGRLCDPELSSKIDYAGRRRL